MEQRRHVFTSKEEMEKQLAYMEKVKTIHQNAYRGVYVLTFGCQQNEADSERLLGIAVRMGYSEVKTAEEADLILVNTCAVREHAEKKVLSIIGKYKHLKKTNPNLIVGVGGCMTAQKHRVDKIKISYGCVDFVFSSSAMHRIPELMYNAMNGAKRYFPDPDALPEIAEGVPVQRGSTYKAWVSIMYGCNNFCSYCIVPYVRGRERSRKPEDILAEVESLVRDGYKDITLLGQNVNSYGHDLDTPLTFAHLLERIVQIEGDYRIRFMSSHPKDVSDDLIAVMQRNPKIARSYHLALQSGSDRILKIMNRRYTAEAFLTIVKKLRAAMPDIAITTDIIVGFPGETEGDFEATLDVLRKAEFDMIFSFLYSPRRGTPAAEMEDPISEKTKGEWFSRLVATQNDIAHEKNKKYIGQVKKVLVEGPSKTNKDIMSGRTDENKLVHFVCPPDAEGHFVDVKITETDTFVLFGDLCK